MASGLQETDDFKDLNDLLKEFEKCHKYLESQSERKDLSTEDKKEIMTSAMHTYSIGLDLIDYVKDMLGDYRKAFKIKEADVKKWMAQAED